MKRFFYYLTLLSSLIAFVIGCSKEEEELPKLELNATELTFKSEGGDELVGVTSNTNWSAVSSEKWCEVSPSSSKGDGAIKVSTQKNEKRESRTAKISVVSGSLTRIVVVSQAGAGSENGSGGNNEEGGNGSGNENGGSNGSNNDGGDTPTPTVTYQVTLTSSLTVGGTVTGGGSYEKGKVVTISASANSGYKFVKWSDGNTSSIRTITVTGNQSLMAYFEIVRYTVTLTSSPIAGGTVTGGGSYEKGKVVTISASANSGYKFVKWDDGETSASRTFTVNGNRSLTAYFEQNPVQQYSITLSKSPSAGGSVYGGGTYEEGKIVTITATPATGYEFTKWSDGVTINPRTITVSKDMSLTANFEKKSNTTFGETNGVEYVDLGLPSGNLWATMNIGADKIEAYGDLYSWGETSTKDNYGENYYSFYKIKGYTKYVPKDKASEYGYGGFFDNKTTLDLTDDVAHAKLGGSWRMPTKEDFDELLENCDKVWCYYQGIGVKGWKFTAKNGKWLFLPAAGFSYGSYRSYEGSRGLYWSSSLDSDNPSVAYRLYFLTGNTSGYYFSRSDRSYGCSVRAVCPSAR